MLPKKEVLYIAGNIPLPTRKENRVVLEIAETLSNLYDISIIYPKEYCPFPINRTKKFRYLKGIPALWQDNGIKISSFTYYRLPLQSTAFSMLPLARRAFLKRLEQTGLPALIHSHFVLPDAYFGYMAHLAYGIPYIVSIRCSDVANFQKCHLNKKEFALVIEKAAAVVVHNKSQEDFIKKNFLRDYVLIPHGIDASILKEKTLVPYKKDIIITVAGSMISRKRMDWVIRAVKEYKGDRNLTLKIIGDGPERRKLKKEAKGWNNIRFYERLPRKQVCELLNESDIFAMPSEKETFGLVYLEAAANMNAVIALKDTGVWGVLKEGEEALFINDYNSFAQKLHLLADNDALRLSLAEKSFEKVKNSYTWDKVRERYDKLYRDIINH